MLQLIWFNKLNFFDELCEEVDNFFFHFPNLAQDFNRGGDLC